MHTLRLCSLRLHQEVLYKEEKESVLLLSLLPTDFHACMICVNVGRCYFVTTGLYLNGENESVLTFKYLSCGKAAL